ncbi:MAG TPA: chemotaxis protein CheA, partial [Acidimicrobiales bacterium]|nr:chemotaxis protein CheA [Acidimicrobiales bacterium]
MHHDDDMREIIDEFLVESHENLDRLDSELVALERDADPETLASIFRTIHTIKGTSGFLGFSVLERLTHVGEHLLSKLRDGELSVTEDGTSALLRMVDVVRELLHLVADAGTDAGGPPIDDLVAELERLQHPSFGELVVAEGLVEQDAVDEAIRRQEDGDPRHIGELLVASGELDPDDVAEALQAQGATRERGSNPADGVIRVDVGLLDDLMNLVGELVLARNQILQFTHAAGDSLLSATSQRLNLITTELQEGVMKTRMQPIDHVWSRFPRVVRDLAVACDKQVRIEMVGRDTELDRTILEAIKDPLTHLIRNSVDHGIEPPDERVSAGKAAQGTVLLRAFHEGGQVNIEISDDGRGLSFERIGAKAVERQLVSPAQLASMAPRDVANLIFEPGFSTAEQVTNVSGRGVGMDVVRTNVEGIGGTIDVQTEAGRGTTFRIRIPLTLAIIPALVVRSGGERYAIPQVSLLELLRIDRREAPVETIAGAPVHRLRGELLPLVDLGEVLGASAGDPSAVDGSDPDISNIVVVQADGRPFGLVVDEIMDTAEIVVKPLGPMLKVLDVFAGATIMGDGRVALILDVPGIAGHSGVFGPAADARRDVGDDDALDDALRCTLLLASVGDRRVALMLDLVARLEEIPVSRIERAGGRLVVQYRGQIMPLVPVADALGGHLDLAAREQVSVV